MCDSFFETDVSIAALLKSTLHAESIQILFLKTGVQSNKVYMYCIKVNLSGLEFRTAKMGCANKTVGGV